MLKNESHLRERALRFGLTLLVLAALLFLVYMMSPRAEQILAKVDIAGSSLNLDQQAQKLVMRIDKPFYQTDVTDGAMRPHHRKLWNLHRLPRRIKLNNTYKNE